MIEKVQIRNTLF